MRAACGRRRTWLVLLPAACALPLIAVLLATHTRMQSADLVTYTWHRVATTCWRPEPAAQLARMVAGAVAASNGSLSALNVSSLRHLPARTRLHVCTLQKDEWPLTMEWLAFTRAQGAGRITMWDDASSPAMLAALHNWTAAIQRAGMLEVHDVRSLTARVAVLHETKSTLRQLHAYRVGRGEDIGEWCGPTDEDLRVLRACAASCVELIVSKSVFYSCQTCAISTCAAWSKLAGNGYVGVWDVDEFLFDVALQCAQGGCQVTPHTAPLLPGSKHPSLVAAVERRMPMRAMYPAVIVVHGYMFGTNGHANRSSWLGRNDTEHPCCSRA
jgi:hypothetical protein